jgi:hypothetical protein
VLPRGPVGGGQDALLFFFEQCGIGCVAAIQVEKQFKDVRVSNNLVIAVRLARTVHVPSAQNTMFLLTAPLLNGRSFQRPSSHNLALSPRQFFCVTRQTQ